MPTEKDVWFLLWSYFKEYGFVRHQLESYDHFTHSVLHSIIHESPELRVRQGDEEHVVTLCNVSVRRPTTEDSDGVERELMPHMARLRGLTYASAVLVDVVHDIRPAEGHEGPTERRIYRETCLCHLPTMLGSRCCHTYAAESPFECRLDQGGYFIVSGNEKMLIPQEKLHHNVPYVFAVKQPSRYALQCEMRSCHERKLRSTSSLYLHLTNGKRGAVPEILASLPFLTTQISLRQLFALLGVSERARVLRLVVGDARDGGVYRLLHAVLGNDLATVEPLAAVLEEVGLEGTKEPTTERRARYIDHIVNCEVLPHEGLVRTPEVLRAKATFLGIMVRRMLRVHLGDGQCDDRDHMATKRVDCAGTQFGLLFRQLFRSVTRSLSVQLARTAAAGKMSVTHVGRLVAGKKITQAFRYGLSTGNWGIHSTRGNTAQHGIAQQLTRMTSITTLAQLRKLSTPVAKETKNPKPRQLHPTTWGLICPMDTPEGAACGLTKSLALMAHVRVGTYSVCVREQLDALRADDGPIGRALRPLAREEEGGEDAIVVLVNGCIYGFVARAAAPALLAELRRLRCALAIPFDASLFLDADALIVETDAGCLLRPLLRVDRLHLLSETLRSIPPGDSVMMRLVAAGVVEYVDKMEEHACRVALSPLREPEEGWAAFTHCEIDPSLIVGVCGGSIPFADYNQSPRNTYQSAMMKQALGVYALSYPMRMDTNTHILVAPQRPLVTTRLDALVGASDAPAGVNAIVAIMCYTGQNQEDSVIINRAALGRGMFRSVKFQCFRDVEHQNGGTDAERFENVGKLSNVIGRTTADYSKLEADGLVAVGSVVKPNDVLLSKTIMTTEVGEGTRRTVKRDHSTVLRHDKGTVDAVLRVVNPDGTHMARVRVRDTRTPQVGDKFSSRMGQKGVVGSALPQEDMPYTADGLTPDIIMNPHAVPSRMTIGQILETLEGILCSLTGERGDGTMFRGTSVEYLCERLKQAGYDEQGRVTLYNGFTGEAFPAKVFVGPTYYQRLRHMAADKYHGRSRGPVNLLSRQPTEGRSREGGLRFGEMEKDCVIAHGAAEFLKDRLLDNSDPSTLTLCRACGLPAQPSMRNSHLYRKVGYCKACDREDTVCQMQVPFAFRLLVQELAAMNVAIRFEIGEDGNTVVGVRAE